MIVVTIAGTVAAFFSVLAFVSMFISNDIKTIVKEGFAGIFFFLFFITMLFVAMAENNDSLSNADSHSDKSSVSLQSDLNSNE